MLAFISLLAIDSPSKQNKKDETNFCVKVLLTEKNVNDIFCWIIESEDGFLLSDPCLPRYTSHYVPGTRDERPKTFYFASKKLKIQTSNKNIYINGKRYLRNQIKIEPRSGHLSFDSNSYQGNFIIAIDSLTKPNNPSIFLINKLDLEDYIFAVLRSESWPGWPLEVNKVFAIAIRSYVISKVIEAKRCKRLYHIKNDNSHQTYHGHAFMKRNSDILRKAVEQTRGIFLAYNNEPIVAMFDSCCGSVIPAQIEGSVDFDKAPYLARGYACKYCNKCSLYDWEVNYGLEDWQKLLSKECPDIKNIKSIWVSKKDKSGLVKEVTIRGAKRSWKISGDKLYGLLKDVKSFCFSIKKVGKNVVIKGKGYGHHIGLCQWGARQMVRELFDYKQILKFYYPGTEFMRLS